jgi:L-ascorbate metabolism protein UlaG (beta-lactamase superfamily)
MKIQLIRNATLRITYAGHTFLIDPYLADKHAYDPFAGKSRNPTVELPIPVDEVIKDIEMVIVSHLHSDHFDKEAQRIIPKDMHLFCEPGDVAPIMDQGFTNVKPIQNTLQWEGIMIHRTPGAHGTGEWGERMGTVSGFIFEADDEPTLYWMGDTIWYDEVKDIVQDSQPGVIVTHSCGAVLGDSDPIVMDAKQTVAVCETASEAIVVATHMDALDHGTISRASLRTYAHAKGINEHQLLIPEDGDILSFD